MRNSREVWSWALYDWANSAFATTVMAGFFPLFFKEYWASGYSAQESTFYLGGVNSAASIALALFSPVLGAIADSGRAKKLFLAAFVSLGVFGTAALFWAERGQWKPAALFFMLGTIGFMGSNTFYDSLLPGISSEKTIDRISALGYALGYVGGGLLFALNVAMVLKPSFFSIANAELAVRLSFLTAAIWWALFTIPLFLFVPEPEGGAAVPLNRAVAAGFKRLSQTIKAVRQLKVVGIFLAAYWLYIDGVDTIVRMAVDYGLSLGFPTSSLITALLLVQFVAFPSAVAYGFAAERIGAKKAVLTAIAAYAGITLLGYSMRSTAHFYALAVLVGLFQGGIQALSRSLYSRIIPPGKTAEFFGVYNMLGKFAAVLGPLMMGLVTLKTGNPRLGILSLLILFAGGAALLLCADIEEGERAARSFPS